jgi:heme oxygenase
LTWENHKRAENTPFIRKLLNRELGDREYSVYLANQYLMYKVLEEDAYRVLGDSEFVDQIKRNPRILMDYVELSVDNPPIILNSTIEYIKHVKTLKTKDDIMSHLYVRHMGDLYGGQILKKLVPGSGAMYDFETDIKELRVAFGRKLKTEMAKEANVCFGLIIDFLNELEINLCQKYATD